MMEPSKIDRSVLIQTCTKLVRSGLSSDDLDETLLMYCRDGGLSHREAGAYVFDLGNDVYSHYAEKFEDEFITKRKRNLKDRVILVYNLPDKKKKKPVKAKLEDLEDKLEESGVEPDLDAPEGARYVENNEEERKKFPKRKKDDEDEVPPGEGDGDKNRTDDDDQT